MGILPGDIREWYNSFTFNQNKFFAVAFFADFSEIIAGKILV